MLSLFFVALPSGGGTSITRMGEGRYRLRHSSTFSAAGGGEAGWEKAAGKSATLCSILGFEYLVLEDLDQYRKPRNPFGTGYGSTVLDVQCLAEETGIAEAFAVVELETGDSSTRRKVQAAIEEMLAEEERERRRLEKLENRNPEKIAKEKEKLEARRRKELERMRREDEKRLAEALEELARRAKKRAKKRAN